jgi:hypothetical protein
MILFTAVRETWGKTGMFPENRTGKRPTRQLLPAGVPHPSLPLTKGGTSNPDRRIGKTCVSAITAFPPHRAHNHSGRLRPWRRPGVSGENTPPPLAYIQNAYTMCIYDRLVFRLAGIGFGQVLASFVQSALRVVIGLDCQAILIHRAVALAGAVEDLA